MRDPDFIIGPPEAPYLRRWWLIPRNHWCNIYLHNFLHSDDDRALHDHMYHNVSVLLSGSYREHFLDGWIAIRKPWRPWAFWRLTFRRPATAHRVELIDDHPVWTLFLTGPRIREWGFHCPQGWRHWREFTDARDKGQIGRGCD
jgi:hypothetical protein